MLVRCSIQTRMKEEDKAMEDGAKASTIKGNPGTPFLLPTRRREHMSREQVFNAFDLEVSTSNMTKTIQYY